MASPSPDTQVFNSIDVLHGRQPTPRGSFLDHLPAAKWALFLAIWGSDARTYPKGAELPLRPKDTSMYVVLGGCVVQERFPFNTKIARFRGVGQVLGEAKLIEPRSSVRTVCLTTTRVLPCDTRRVNLLLTQDHEAKRALLRSLEDRNRSDERIYATTSRSPLARVSALLHHLAMVAGTQDPAGPTGHTIIDGPRQQDLAEALLLGRSTVENAVATLRKKRLIDSRYRRLVVTDLPALKALVTSQS
jgi:CRP-like cAMP-binding protein